MVASMAAGNNWKTSRGCEYVQSICRMMLRFLTQTTRLSSQTYTVDPVDCFEA